MRKKRPNLNEHAEEAPQKLIYKVSECELFKLFRQSKSFKMAFKYFHLTGLSFLSLTHSTAPYLDFILYLAFSLTLSLFFIAFENFTAQVIWTTFSVVIHYKNPLKHVTHIKRIQMLFPFQLCHLTLTELCAAPHKHTHAPATNTNTNTNTKTKFGRQ